MDTPEPTVSSLRQALTLTLLFTAGVINFFDRASLSVANNSVRAEMHLSATQMGWLLSAFSLAYGLSQLPLITLLPRFGARKALGFGLTLWSAAQLLTGYVRSFTPFILLRVLLGTGEAPFYPAGVQATRDWFSERSRGRATAVMSMSQTIGLAVAPAILAMLILRTGWRAMFILLGLAGLLIAIAWSVFYRSRSSSTTDSPSTTLDTLGFLLKHRVVWGMMLGWGGINYTNWLYISWVPGYLQTARHLSLANTGMVAGIPFLAGAAGMFSSGALADFRTRHGASLARVHYSQILTGMALSAASTWFVAHAATTTTAIAGISGALFMIHFGGTSGWGYVQVIGGPRYVASLGPLQNFASFVIASAAPVVTGFLLDTTHSFTLALIICSAVTLLGALCYATLGAPSLLPQPAKG
jgi:MFS transporter, ACS family, L-galactonate transporter